MNKIKWTPDVAAAIDAQSLLIYRREEVKRKTTAEETLAQLVPPEKYQGFVRLFHADVLDAEAIIAIIEAELTSRGMPFE